MTLEITGAVIFAVAYGLGLLTGRRRRRQPEEVCPCGHGHNFHDATGCRQPVKGRPVRWDNYDIPIDWEREECPCVSYGGPGSSYVPELAGNGG